MSDVLWDIVESLPDEDIIAKENEEARRAAEALEAELKAERDEEARMHGFDSYEAYIADQNAKIAAIAQAEDWDTPEVYIPAVLENETENVFNKISTYMEGAIACFALNTGRRILGYVVGVRNVPNLMENWFDKPNYTIFMPFIMQQYMHEDGSMSSGVTPWNDTLDLTEIHMDLVTIPRESIVAVQYVGAGVVSAYREDTMKTTNNLRDVLVGTEQPNTEGNGEKVVSIGRKKR